MMKKVYRSMLAVGLLAGTGLLSQPAFADEVKATCTFTVKTCGSNLSWGSTVTDIAIAVMEPSESAGDGDENQNPTYYITETDGLGLLQYDQYFVYNEGGAVVDGYPNTAEFNQQYEGYINGMYMWTTPCLMGPEPQDKLGAAFDWETGFKFLNKSATDPTGFLFLSSSTDKGLSPNMNYVAGILITEVKDWKLAGAETVTYPSPEEIAGDYSFSAASYSLNESSYSDVFSQKYNFTIANLSGTLYLQNFLWEGSNLATTYNPETGELIVNSIMINPGNKGTYMAIAPQPGGFNGQTTALKGGNQLVLQVSPEGEISCPGFSIGTYQLNEPGLTVAYVDYGDITIGEPLVTYPSLEDLLGTYKFSSSVEYTSTLTNAALKEQLVGEYEFTLEATTTSSGTIKNLFNTGQDVGFTYNPETGDLTLGKVFYSNIVTGSGYTYIAPEGIYTGFSAGATFLTLKVAADGTITCPDVELGTVASNVFTAQAKYSNIEITAVSEEESNSSFEGTYTVYGTTYTYENNQVQSASTGNMTITINANNQLVSILDQTLTEQEISDKRNEGSVANGVYTLESSFFNGFNFGSIIVNEGTDNEQNYTVSDLLGGPGSSFEQGEIAISLQKDDDGTVTLAPFSLWHNGREYNADKQTYERVYTLLYRWAPGKAEEVVDFEGTYDLDGKYYTYDAEGNVTEQDGLNIAINSSNQLITVGSSYSLDDYDIKDGRNIGTADGESLVWTAGMDFGLSWEEMIFISGESVEAYDSEATVSFTKTSDEDFMMTPFTIWQRGGSYPNWEYTLLASYNVRTPEPEPSYPSLTQLEGEYNFQADITIEDDYSADYADYFQNGNFSMVWYETSDNIRVEGWLNEEYGAFIDSYDQSTGTITFNFEFGYGPDYTWLLIGDADGNNPNWGEDYKLQMTIDSEGNMTCPSFTILGEDWGETYVIARFNNVKVTRTNGFVEDEDVDFFGTYTVTGTYTPASTIDEPAATADDQDSFLLEIGEDGQLVGIAGYRWNDLKHIYRQDNPSYLNTWLGRSSWTLSCYNSYLTLKGVNNQDMNVVLGGESTSSYQNGAEITLSYNNGEYSLNDFTLWIEAPNVEEGGNLYTLIGKWSNLSVEKTSDLVATGIDTISADSDAPVVYYNLQGVKIAKPAKGGIYIRVQGNKSSKVIF